MATLRSDVIVPEVFTAYVDEAVTTRSAFLSSGVIQPLDILNATEGGDYVNVPSWSDRKSTRLNSSHVSESRMPSSA